MATRSSIKNKSKLGTVASLAVGGVALNVDAGASDSLGSNSNALLESAFRLLEEGQNLFLSEEDNQALEKNRLKLEVTPGAVAGDSVVTHAKTGKSLRYGELAAGAAERSLSSDPVLKSRKDYKLIGKPVTRLDIPAKVDGSAVYGIDFTLPDMRVATIAAAPVRGGKLESVDTAPAMAVKGVEKVVKLDDAVIVIGSGYWPAKKGLAALSPKFTDGGHAAVSTPAIYAAQAKLMDRTQAREALGGLSHLIDDDEAGLI